MKQKLTEISEKIKKNIKYRIGVSVLFLLLILAAVWIYPIKAQNVSLYLLTDQIPDETIANWAIFSEKAYDKVTEGKTYFCNGKIGIRLNPEFRNMDSVELKQGEFADHINGIEITSGKFVKEDPVIGRIAGEKLFEEQDGKAVMSASAVEKIKKIIRNEKGIHIRITLFLIALYGILVLFWLLDAKFERYQSLSVCAVCLGLLLFCIQMSYNHDNVKVPEGSNVESQYFELTDENCVAEQEFTATSRRMSSILILYRIEEGLDCGILMEVVNADSGEVMAKEIVSTRQFGGNAALYDFIFDKEIPDLGGTYLFRTRCIDNPNKQKVFVIAGDADSYTHGQMIYNGERLDVDMAMKAYYARLQNMMIARVICVFLSLLLIACILTLDIKDEKWRKRICAAIYAVLFCYALFQMLFYLHYVGRTPDESKHLAYVAYLEQENVILPDMREMRGISKPYDNGSVQEVYFSNAVNYLRHPPLYYQILRLANAYTFKDDGMIRIEARRLRLFSMSFAVLAFVIMFYLGYTRLSKKPYIHLLFGTVCISVPMLTYGVTGISNDTLALLTVTVFFWGILRLTEHKWNAGTYWLIAVGMTATLLTKATAGILVAFAGALILMYYLIKEKCYRELLKPAFLITIPVYMVALAYYIWVYREYGAFQPDLYDIMSVEQVRNSSFYKSFQERSFMDLGNYINYYLKNFMNTWTGVSSHVSISKVPNSGISSLTLGLISLWIIPFFCFIKKIRKSSAPYTVAVGGMLAATFFTFVSQLVHAYKGFIVRGWDGSFQSRYYLCGIIMMAMSAGLLVQGIDKNINSKETYGLFLKRGLALTVLCFAAMLFYEDFIYFLLNFTSYPIFYG